LSGVFPGQGVGLLKRPAKSAFHKPSQFFARKLCPQRGWRAKALIPGHTVNMDDFLRASR
jgi:hypothetical protein